MIVPINITGGSYKSRSLPLSAQVTRNLYPEIQESQQAKNQYVLQSFPGYAAFADGDSGSSSDTVNFDGYLYRLTDLTGNTDGKTGTYAALFRLGAGTDGAPINLLSNYDGGATPSGGLLIFRTTNNTISINARKSDGTDLIIAESDDTFTHSDGWLSVVFSWDAATVDGYTLTVNNAPRTMTVSDWTDDIINYTRPTWGINVRTSSIPADPGANVYDIDFGFIWFDHAEVTDYSLFFDANGAPQDIGVSGDVPTGSDPILYLYGNDFNVNKGSGGDFVQVGTFTSGTAVFSPATPERGTFEHLGILYQVAGTKLYSITSAGVRTELGTITGSDPCIFDGIGSSIVIVSEGNMYVWDGSTLTTVSDPDLETPNSVAHINNQILIDGDDGRFASSAVGDATDIPALNYATAESNADNLKRVYVMGNTVYMMGDRTIEQWWNSGSGSPPFDRVEGGTIPVGLLALYSVADNGDAMYFLGHDLRVWAVSGTSKKIISTIAISNAIEGYSTVTDAQGTYFTFQGQGFYHLTFPTADKSWCFHEQSGEWFEVSSGADGGRSVFNHAVRCYNKTLVSDYETGAIYELDVDAFDENGDTIHRVRDSGPIHGGLFGKPGAWLEMNKLELIMETGVGDLTDTPEVMISWSDDGGRTFGTEVYGTVNIGTAGQYQKKVEVFCMGGFYERIIRVRMTEAVRWSIHSASAEIEVGI